MVKRTDDFIVKQGYNGACIERYRECILEHLLPISKQTAKPSASIEC